MSDSFESMVDNNNDNDPQLFPLVREHMESLFSKASNYFDWSPHALSSDTQQFEAPGGLQGWMKTFEGELVDYAMFSAMFNPAGGFANITLNIWLNGKRDAPHFCMIFALMPAPFYYQDFIARVPLAANPDYCDKFYTPYNDSYQAIQKDDSLNPFRSPNTYMRACMSPVANSLMGAANAEVVDKFAADAEARLLQWLDSIARADQPDSDQQSILLANDRHLRQQMAEKDPANAMAAKLLGEQLAAKLQAASIGPTA